MLGKICGGSGHPPLLFMLWNHFVMLDNTSLTKQVFEWDMDRKRDNWSADMEHLFDLVDMTDIFERKSPCNLDLVSRKLFLLMQEEWEKSLPSKPKLRTYIKFKETLKTEEYVKVCLSRMQRSLLAQFRSGILPLYVETGRYRGIQLENRICVLCTKQEIEDECHFLCKCDFYYDLRKSLYESVTNRCPEFVTKSSDEKFVYLMSYECKLVAKYIQNAWLKRREALYQVVS